MQILSTQNSETEAPSLAPFVEVEGVSKVYPTKDGGEAVILDNVNLTVAEGEFVCVIGHSGCGKSTLLDMVSGFRQPSSGEVRVQGKRVVEPGPERMVVFQNYSLLPWKPHSRTFTSQSTRSILKSPKQTKSEIVNRHLAMVGLEEAANKNRDNYRAG